MIDTANDCGAGGKQATNNIALGLDLRQMSLDPSHEAQQPYAVGDPYNVPVARPGLSRMSIMQQQVRPL